MEPARSEDSVNRVCRHKQAQRFAILRSKEFTSRILLAQFPKQSLLNSACFGKLLFIQEIESSAKLWNSCEGWRIAARHHRNTDGWTQEQ